MNGFEHPAALSLLLLIPLYFILRSFGIVNVPFFFLTLGDWKGMRFEKQKDSVSVIRVISRLLFALGFIALVGACAEPVFWKQEKRFISRGAEIIFIVDTSPSMAALDIAAGSRLQAAKQAIALLVRENKGISYGLVSCASEAALLVPPTLDQSTFFARLHAMEVGELGDGSALGVGLSTAVYHLASSLAPVKAAVLLTDGENNAGSVHPNTAAALAKDNGIRLYIAGIGTKGSVPIEYTDLQTGKVYSGYFDSEFNDSSLRSLAAEAQGAYYPVETLPALSSALQSIGIENSVNQTYTVKRIKTPLYSYCLALALALFAVSWLVCRLYLQESV